MAFGSSKRFCRIIGNAINSSFLWAKCPGVISWQLPRFLFRLSAWNGFSPQTARENSLKLDNCMTRQDPRTRRTWSVNPCLSLGSGYLANGVKKQLIYSQLIIVCCAVHWKKNSWRGSALNIILKKLIWFCCY